MSQKNKDNKVSIDVIIPLYKPNYSIKILLYCLLNQTLKPNKIIIINSGSNKNIDHFLQEICNNNKIIENKKFSKLNPGQARNKGIELCNSKYVTFFDVNTFASLDWIEKNLKKIKESFQPILFGQRETIANSLSKNINKWSTYGDETYIALTGTIVETYFLKKNDLYFTSTRAGEDIEWIERAKKLSDKNISLTSKIYYNGLYDSVIKSLYKWYNYAFSYANIKKDINNQKKLFFFVLIYILFFSYIVFSINNYFLLIFLLVNILIYFLFFSIIRPYKKNVGLNLIFPFNWLLIGFYRSLLDLAKLPGLVYGQIKIILSLFLK